MQYSPLFRLFCAAVLVLSASFRNVIYADETVDKSTEIIISGGSNPLIRLPALCALPKEYGDCAKRIQRFYFEPSVGVCVSFAYSGCGGNENNFDTREECENACMPLEGAALCADARSILRLLESAEVATFDCVTKECPAGFVCVSNSVNSICCNATVEGFYEEARSAECAPGKRAFQSPLFSNLVFGVDCAELLCGDGYRCDRINPLFVKCCAVKPRSPDDSAVTKKRQSLEESGKEDLAVVGELRRDYPIGSTFSMEVCHLPRNAGYCYKGATPEVQQQFFYDSEWQSCFAFKYSGCGGNANRFPTRTECETSCFFADGSVCKGPWPSVQPLNFSLSCSEAVCPDGYVCAHGFGFVECCNTTTFQYISDAYASECPDGTSAGGVQGDYFMATFAKTCDDLICNKDQHCLQVSPEFAKCCGLTVSRKTTTPSEGLSSQPPKNPIESLMPSPNGFQPYLL